jgi:hypothetical protein
VAVRGRRSITAAAQARASRQVLGDDATVLNFTIRVTIASRNQIGRKICWGVASGKVQAWGILVADDSRTTARRPETLSFLAKTTVTVYAHRSFVS